MKTTFSSEAEFHLTQLWHTSRIALAGQDCSRHARLRWAAKEWEKTNPGQRLAAYKRLSDITTGY